jgi:RimJ/RimL family protein N-acetyltransferase
VTVTFVPADVIGADRGEFTRFMSRDRFPFHMVASPTEEQVALTLDAGRYRNRAPFWVEETEHGRIGVAVLDGLRSSTLSFDLRLTTRYRARGLGVPIVRALTTLAFEAYPRATRLEGETRADHTAMRKTFVRSGFVKEAHRRDVWPVDGGTALASVTYAILRRDWESGTTTEIVWDDLIVR